MKNGLPREREILFALLALHFEYVPFETWIQAWHNQMNAAPSTEGTGSIGDHLSREQSDLLNQLINQWENQPNQLAVMIDRVANSLGVAENAAGEQTLTTVEDSLKRLESKIDSLTTVSPGNLDDDTRASSVPNENSATTSVDSLGRQTDFSIDSDFDSENGESREARIQVDSFSDGSRYEIIEPLAEGGLGKVLIARDHQLGRNVALKKIKAKFSESLNSQRRFVFEAAVTGQLEHPGIVPVYSLGRDQSDSPFYAMRLIEGNSFSEAISQFHQSSDEQSSVSQGTSRDSVGFRQLLQRFIDLCQAIDFAHSRGIIHRDLKPSNVMVGYFGQTFVVDWGLARQFETDAGSEIEESDSVEQYVADQTRQGTVIGTPAYMSPEQAKGDIESLGPASDIYSLGSILFTLLTGNKAYSQSDTRSLLKAVQQSEFDAPSSVDKSVAKPLNAICLKAMSLKVEDRYSSAGEMAKDIERWLADEPVLAWREPVLTRTNRWLKRHRTLVASAVAMLLVSTVALIVVLAIQNENNRQLLLANQREKEATQLAQQQFELALDAIGQYHNGITSDFILGQAEFGELQAKLLVGPQKFYRDLNRTLEGYSNPTREHQVALMHSHRQLARLASQLNDRKSEWSEYEEALKLCRNLQNQKSFSSEEQGLELGQVEVQILVGMAANHESNGQYVRSREVFREAIQRVESLPRSEDHSMSLQKLKSQVYSSYAMTLKSEGKPADAIEYMKKSIAIDRALLKLTNLDEERRSLATALNMLSNVLSDAENTEQAIKAAEEAVDIFAEFQQQETQDTQLMHAHSACLTNLAYLYQEQQKFEKAILLYGKSEQTYRNLVAEAPNIVAFRTALAATLNNMGLLYVALEKREQAEEKYIQTIRLKEQLVEDFPDTVDFQVSLGGGYVNMGGFYHQEREYEEAIAWYDRAAKLLDQVVEQHPRNALAAQFQLNGRTNRFQAHRRLENHSAALTDLEFILKHKKADSNTSSLKNQKAQLLALTGDHSEASQFAITLRSQASSDRDFYNLVFIQALAVEAAEQDLGINDQEKQEKIGIYVGRAIEDLRSMHGTRALNDQQFAEMLDQNPYLKSLRSKEPFKSFRAEFDQ